ncbi:MAG: isoaspartyl peptidase/L-asparaginase [Candidatus Saliniplasma sp.]
MKVLAHGGVGSPREMDKNVKDAVEKGIDGKEKPLEIVIGVVKELEDDPIFNAGTGSRIRLDGSVQMDAAVMSDGDIGAVSAIERVKNPVVIAKEIYDSPFVMFTGIDSTNFARDLGYREHDPVTEKRKDELSKMKEKLDGTDGSERLKRIREFYDQVDGGDTVGCVAEVDGEYAAAVSTGGTSYCVRGRVGDSPLVGCGFYAGEHGAVVTTGKGEEIIKRMSAKKCYDLIPEYGIDRACELVVEEYPEEISIGVIAVNDEGTASADNRDMSQYGLNNI